MTDKEHRIKNVSSGDEWESFLTPVCSCGWRGKAISDKHNWQMHELAKAIQGHKSWVNGQPRK